MAQNVLEAPLDHRIIRLDDPEFATREPYELYRRLRNEAPVFWYEPVGFWVLSRHADIREVSRSASFTTTKGVTIADFKYGNIVAECFPAGAESLNMTDDPRHKSLRKLLGPAFGPAAISRLQSRIREIAVTLLSDVVPGEEFDFVEKIAVPLPLIVIAELLGLRAYDLATLKLWTDNFIGTTGSMTSRDQLPAFLEAIRPQVMFFLEEIHAQRSAPQGGLISTLIDAQNAGEQLSEETFVQFCQLILVAGNETTRNALSGQMRLLLENPDQLALLRADPSLGANASDEAVRLTNPAIGFMRVATEDVELRGTRIKAGDAVFMLYPAGNRDEDVFEDPHRYNIMRKNVGQNVAFGFGTHFCAGIQLARAELQILFEEMLARFSQLRPTGPAIRQKSILNNGITYLPMVADI